MLNYNYKLENYKQLLNSWLILLIHKAKLLNKLKPKIYVKKYGKIL